MSFSSGKNAWGISDRSGRRYRLREMKKEWTGSLVGPDEYESKHPQLFPPRISPDPQALQNARPDRKEPAVEVLLQKNPFSVISGFGSATLTIKVFEPSHGRETGDTVRFRKAQGFGVVTSARLNDSDGHTITKIDADNYSFTVASEDPFAMYEQLQYILLTGEEVYFQATMISKDIPLGNAQIGGGQGPRYQKQYDLWYSNTYYSSGELGLVYPSGRYSSQFTLPFQQWWTPGEWTFFGGQKYGEPSSVFSSDQYGGDTGGETNSAWLFHVWYADNFTDPKTPWRPTFWGEEWIAEEATGYNVYRNSKYPDVVTYIEGTMLPFMVSNLDIYGEYFTTTTLKGGGTVASAGPVTVEA